MNSLHQRHRKLPYLIAAVALVLIGGAILAYALHPNATKKDSSGDSGVNYTPPTSDEQQGEKTAEQTKPPATDGSNSSQTGGTSSGTSGSSSGTGTTKKSVSVEITAANQNASTVTVRSIISGVVTNDGTCTLTLSKQGSSSVVKTSSAQSVTTYTTCKGFSLSSDGLAKGTWNVSLSYASSSYQGSAATTMEIK